MIWNISIQKQNRYLCTRWKEYLYIYIYIFYAREIVFDAQKLQHQIEDAYMSVYGISQPEHTQYIVLSQEVT